MDDSIFYRRKSLRSYLDKPIPQDVLDRVFDKARWSPSAGNHQPWRFVVAKSPEAHAKFVEGLSRGNLWAAKAPILIAVCSRQKDDGVRDDDPVMYYQFATGLATMGLLLAAVDEGLLPHPMGGYDAHKLHEAFAIPPEYHIMCVVSLGYQGPIELLDERTKEKDLAPRTRKPLSEIVSYDTFDFHDPA